jgi:hypothetical protein
MSKSHGNKKPRHAEDREQGSGDLGNRNHGDLAVDVLSILMKHGGDLLDRKSYDSLSATHRTLNELSYEIYPSQWPEGIFMGGLEDYESLTKMAFSSDGKFLSVISRYFRSDDEDEENSPQVYNLEVWNKRKGLIYDRDIYPQDEVQGKFHDDARPSEWRFSPDGSFLIFSFFDSPNMIVYELEYDSKKMDFALNSVYELDAKFSKNYVYQIVPMHFLEENPRIFMAGHFRQKSSDGELGENFCLGSQHETKN